MAASRRGTTSAPLAADIVLLAADYGSLRVFPSPWVATRHRGRPIQFDGLTAGSVVKIFTIDGRHVVTLPSESGAALWRLTTADGDAVASGIYLYRITDPQGAEARGKFGVVR